MKYLLSPQWISNTRKLFMNCDVYFNKKEHVNRNI